MDDESRAEFRSHALLEPLQVPAVRTGRGRGRLDLDRDDLSVPRLDQQVNLVPAVGVAQVEQIGPDSTDRALGPELGGDERVDQPSQKVTVAQRAALVDAQYPAGCLARRSGPADPRRRTTVCGSGDPAVLGDARRCLRIRTDPRHARERRLLVTRW
jgi:hypothetical protein